VLFKASLNVARDRTGSSPGPPVSLQARLRRQRVTRQTVPDSIHARLVVKTTVEQNNGPHYCAPRCENTPKPKFARVGVAKGKGQCQ
jgi:hypothetical protein